MSTPLNFLILEDNIFDLDLLQRELKKSSLKFTSYVVQNRETFEAALYEYKPDMVLADYALPNFDGYSAFKILQEKQVDIPFIIVSGSIGEERAVELIKNGVTDYVLKDRLFTLEQKIKRALNDNHTRRVKKDADEKIRQQNTKLIEIAHFQSHIVRTPICQMQGLMNLIDFDNLGNPENLELLNHMKDVVNSIDSVIYKIVRMTDEVENMTVVA